MTSTPRPGCQHLLRKLKNTFLPSVSNKYIAVKSLWIHHQCPAHFASGGRDRLDEIFIDCINAGPKRKVEVFLKVQSASDGSVDLRLKELQVSPGDAPSGGVHPFMQFDGFLRGTSPPALHGFTSWRDEKSKAAWLNSRQQVHYYYSNKYSYDFHHATRTCSPASIK